MAGDAPKTVDPIADLINGKKPAAGGNLRASHPGAANTVDYNKHDPSCHVVAGKAKCSPSPVW